MAMLVSAASMAAIMAGYAWSPSTRGSTVLPGTSAWPDVVPTAVASAANRPGMCAGRNCASCCFAAISWVKSDESAMPRRMRPARRRMRLMPSIQ